MDTTEKAEKKGPKRIGELLVAANIIKADVLAQALKIAKESKSPIGRTLMSMGKLSQEELEAAIELQGWLREGVISTEFGIRALNVAIKGKISLEQSFSKLGWQPPNREDTPKSELAELILEAGILNFQILDDAVRDSQQNQMTLGRYLVFNNIVSSRLLSSVLTAQVFLRDGKITREQAVLGLRAASHKQQSIEQSLKESGAYHVDAINVRIGDLLTAAGLISEEDKVSAVELGLAQQKPVGEILVAAHMIAEPILEETLKLQKLVNARSISVEEAAKSLKEAHMRGIQIPKPRPELTLLNSEIEDVTEVIEFLGQIGILSKEQIVQANYEKQQKGLTLSEALISSGVLNATLITAGHLAKNLINGEIIDSEQATAILHHCSKENSEFHQALLKVPWLGHRASSDTAH